MTTSQFMSEYFEWMYEIVCDERYNRRLSYRKLLQQLNLIEFQYIIPMDENRLIDGKNLRYRFADDADIPRRIADRAFDAFPCSVLEMMVALAVRCEEHIMDNPEFGDRTGLWFWNMIVSLGLGGMTDSRFDEEALYEIVYRFLDREFEPDGEGGLFTLKNPNYDMRDIEIWYQMNLYLQEYIDEFES